MDLMFHLFVRLLPSLRSQPVGSPGRVAVLTVLAIATYVSAGLAIACAFGRMWVAGLLAAIAAALFGWLFTSVRRPPRVVIDPFNRPDPIE